MSSLPINSPFQASSTLWPNQQSPVANNRPFPLSSTPADSIRMAREPHPVQESAENDAPKEPTTLAGKAWKKFVLFGPLIGFFGSSALLGKYLPKAVKSGLVNGSRKLVGKQTLQKEAIDSGLRNFGQKSLGVSVLIRSLGGISAGIVSGQPSMIWGNLIQLIPSGILFFKKSNTLQNFATSMEMLLGGLYTIGFANELKNKDSKTPTDQIRRYDMSHLKSLFAQNSTLSASQRATGLLSEAGAMAAFTVQDHLLLFRDMGQLAFKKLKQVTGKNPNVDQKPESASEKFGNWAKQPSASKSQLAVLFFYLGTLPIMLLTRKNPKIGEKKAVVALKATGMTIANMAPFAIAMNRDDLRGKAPLIGAPMAVIGMSNSKNPFFVGMGHLGESFSDLFFSDVAVNGVKTKSEPNNDNKQTAP